jgi:hypothetical protein
MNMKNESGGMVGGGASRERYWEEADTEDKVSRLRDEVARLCLVVSEQAAIIVKLGSHMHAQDGRLVVPMVDTLNENRPRIFAHDNGIPHRLRTERERR